MILGTLFIFSNNVSAVSDKVVNIDLSTNWYSSQTLCNNTSECDTYKYVTVTLDSTSTFNANNQVAISIGGDTFCSIKFNFLKSMTCMLAEGQTFRNSSTVYFGSNVSPAPTGNLIYTFSESSSGGSTPCPEPEPCDCDTPPIVAFFRDVFLNVVTGIIPAFAVFVVVWFMVDLLSSLWFGRGK